MKNWNWKYKCSSVIPYIYLLSKSFEVLNSNELKRTERKKDCKSLFRSWMVSCEFNPPFSLLDQEIYHFLYGLWANVLKVNLKVDHPFLSSRTFHKRMGHFRHPNQLSSFSLRSKCDKHKNGKELNTQWGTKEQVEYEAKFQK